MNVTITLLGGFRVTVDGVPTPTHGWARRSAAALVKVLALASGHHLHRERVMDLLWPDEPLNRTAPRLHKAAHFARRAAGRDDAVVLRDDVVWLFPDADLTVDAVWFEQLARTAVGHQDARIARDALAWYGGELLPGDRYESWATDRRELLHLRHLDVLRLSGEWRELAQLDPSDEHARMELVRQHVESGNVCAVLREYEHLEHVLERELGVQPAHAALLNELAEHVRRANELLAELVTVV